MSDVDPKEIQELLEKVKAFARAHARAHARKSKSESKPESKSKPKSKSKSKSKPKSTSTTSNEGIGIVNSRGSQWFDRTVYRSSFGKYIKDKKEGRVYLRSNVKIKTFT